MWQRTDYENAAQKIAREFVENRGNNTVSINQLATKVARDNNLTPEGIRTMVRIANLGVFEEIFHKHAGADKMFEFETGDAEVVINNLYQETKAAMDQHPTIIPDGYDRNADYYLELETPVQSEKVASAATDDTTPLSISPLQLRQRMIQAQEKLALEKKEHEFEWVDALEKAAKSLTVKAPSIPECVSLEKDAVCILGDDIVPELTALREMTGRCTKHALLGGEKTAAVLDKHVANPPTEMQSIIQMLKTANEARNQMRVCGQGLEWLAKNLPRVK